MPERAGSAAAVPAPGTDEVRRIAAIANPILRNLEITQCYARLAAATSAGGRHGANWCTFATWASRQAGRTIRGEDALEFVRSRLARGPELLRPVDSFWRLLLRRGLLDPGSRLGRLTAELHTPFDALELAGDAVARGNKKVFEEIGLEFARFEQECPAGAPEDAAEVKAFLAGLRPGDPPEGQRYLRQAFLRYQRGRTQSDAKARAELFLLANLEIGLHEQTRLQPEIRAALDAPFVAEEEIGRRLLDALLPRGTRARKAVPDRPAAAALGALGSRLQSAGADITRAVITESFMVLSLPGRVLALGAHLPDPYPEALREIDDEELAALLARFEPVAPAPDDCGARDWAELDQRMHYIVHLFRALHEDADLFEAPFTEAQIKAFMAGVIPDGEL